MRVPLMTSCDGSFSSGGGLSGKYYLQQFHFHWGDSDTTGSEHTLDLLHYPVEVHFVHVLEGHNETTAHNATHAIAVVSVMLQVADDKDDVLTNLEDAIIATNTPGRATVKFLELFSITCPLQDIEVAIADGEPKSP
ncbi:carbonate dehydratase, eukaryotic-type [Ancylostoma duodenale]|uniref:Carbonic anhydrase n=1 Tax=Ancylostoma duodenale TaxID=51022 RepID=A0A0C2GW92_9BILA|nr:carbonate dehydratase, eukaryotic-type [Ancylostoma duodenale]